MNPNQRFAELAGICWHDPVFTSIGTDPVEIKHRCIKCHKIVGFHNPDYAAEPWRVLEVMRNKLTPQEFEDFIIEYCDGDNAMAITADGGRESYNMIRVDLILDRTGKLRDAAIEWMEGRKTR